MNISGKTMPAVMGAAMGLMMMWMLHGALTGDTSIGAMALVAFIGAHVVLVAVAVAAVWIGARWSPRIQRLTARLHRPSVSHITTMLASAVIVAGLLHLSVHGLGDLL